MSKNTCELNPLAYSKPGDSIPVIAVKHPFWYTVDAATFLYSTLDMPIPFIPNAALNIAEGGAYLFNRRKININANYAPVWVKADKIKKSAALVELLGGAGVLIATHLGAPLWVPFACLTISAAGKAVARDGFNAASGYWKVFCSAGMTLGHAVASQSTADAFRGIVWVGSPFDIITSCMPICHGPMRPDYPSIAAIRDEGNDCNSDASSCYPGIPKLDIKEEVKGSSSVSVELPGTAQSNQPSVAASLQRGMFGRSNSQVGTQVAQPAKPDHVVIEILAEKPDRVAIDIRPPSPR
jgi:hypothetical protein